MTIKDELAAAVAAALESARASGDLALDEIPGVVTLDIPPSRAHGDFSTDVALTLPRAPGRSAEDVAAAIVAHLPSGDGLIERAVVIAPGFINFTLRPTWIGDVLRDIVAHGARYGRSNSCAGERVLVEYVSANPNGPITVAAGRNAAVGDAISALLEATGCDVTREFYVNDALSSQQMLNFGKSVFHRYLQLCGRPGGLGRSEAHEPDYLYHGEYVMEVARAIHAAHGAKFEDSDLDDPQTLQKFRMIAQDGMIAAQKSDLADFGVVFDSWFSEESLHASGAVAEAIAVLTSRGYTYEKDGARWLRSTDFGDKNDRVLVRANGAPTYIASDVAYHKNKFDRGFDAAIDVWGSEHAGYVARTRAAVAEMGYGARRLEIVLCEPVRVFKDGEPVKSPRRHGDVLELRADLLDDIGRDAARFLFLSRSPSSYLDIDVNVARGRGGDNPLHSVQYAFARLAKAVDDAIAAVAADGGLLSAGGADFSLLTLDSEIDLVRKLSEFPTEVAVAAAGRSPQRISQYARDLASVVHEFYDYGNETYEHRIVCPNRSLLEARAALATAAMTVLQSALALLGVLP